MSVSTKGSGKLTKGSLTEEQSKTESTLMTLDSRNDTEAYSNVNEVDYEEVSRGASSKGGQESSHNSERLSDARNYKKGFQGIESATQSSLNTEKFSLPAKSTQSKRSKSSFSTDYRDSQNDNKNVNIYIMDKDKGNKALSRVLASLNLSEQSSSTVSSR